MYNVFVRIPKESKYFGGLDCRCVQLTCKVWTPSTSLDGDARYKTLKLFPWKPFRQYFGGNLITYWFNLIFVWNGICTAFNRGGAIGSEFNWGRPGTSPVKILSINIAINLDHRFIKYQSTNQYPSILLCWNRIEVCPLPWKYFPPISAICSFKPKITAIRIKNWNLDWIEKQGASRLPLSPDRPFKGKDPKTTATELSKIVLGGFFLLNKTLMPIVQDLPATLYIVQHCRPLQEWSGFHIIETPFTEPDSW